jgi:hypothetical protein
MAQLYQETQVRTSSLGIIMPCESNQSNWKKKEVRYGEEGTHQLQQVQLFMQNEATRHIRTTEGTAGTDQESKTSNT